MSENSEKLRKFYDGIFKEVAVELGMSEDDVHTVYHSFWKTVKLKLGSLQLKGDMTQEEFDKLKTSFNIPKIGKLFCTYERYRRARTRHKYLRRK